MRTSHVARRRSRSRYFGAGLDRWLGATDVAPEAKPKAGLNRRSPTDPETLEGARVVALNADRDGSWSLSLGFGVGTGGLDGGGVDELGFWLQRWLARLDITEENSIEI